MVLVMGLSSAFAQSPPPPNDGSTASGGGTPVGGGAPIGGGIVILVSVALAYGYAKYHWKKPKYTIVEES